MRYRERRKPDDRVHGRTDVVRHTVEKRRFGRIRMLRNHERGSQFLMTLFKGVLILPGFSMDFRSVAYGSHAEHLPRHLVFVKIDVELGKQRFKENAFHPVRELLMHLTAPKAFNHPLRRPKVEERLTVFRFKPFGHPLGQVGKPRIVRKPERRIDVVLTAAGPLINRPRNQVSRKIDLKIGAVVGKSVLKNLDFFLKRPDFEKMFVSLFHRKGRIFHYHVPVLILSASPNRLPTFFSGLIG